MRRRVRPSRYQRICPGEQRTWTRCVPPDTARRSSVKNRAITRPVGQSPPSEVSRLLASSVRHRDRGSGARPAGPITPAVVADVVEGEAWPINCWTAGGAAQPSSRSPAYVVRRSSGEAEIANGLRDRVGQPISLGDSQSEISGIIPAFGKSRTKRLEENPNVGSMPGERPPLHRWRHRSPERTLPVG